MFGIRDEWSYCLLGAKFGDSRFKQRIVRKRGNVNTVDTVSSDNIYFFWSCVEDNQTDRLFTDFYCTPYHRHFTGSKSFLFNIR